MREKGIKKMCVGVQGREREKSKGEREKRASECQRDLKNHSEFRY